MSTDVSSDASAGVSTASQKAESYYDSAEADAFYANIWGGEDIHIGLYEDGDTIRAASRRTVEKMADQLGQLGADAHILDLGAGYGGAARYLARRFGCRVTCLNISDTQNAYNRRYTADAGLAHLVSVEHGSFENVPVDDASVDVVWSQDAFLHSNWRDRVLAEVHRVLRPGGQLIFTDPMQADDCPEGVLQPVLDRIFLDDLGSFGFYTRTARRLGFDVRATIDLSDHLLAHYARVGGELERRYDEMAEKSSKAYLDRMLLGLSHWVKAAKAGHLAWGILHFHKA